MGIGLQSMLTHNQSNSQNQQQLLSRYFLLILENQRLHDRLAQSSNQGQQADNVVLQKIAQIEREMGSELRHKQIRIDELNQYIKHIHQQKEQLMAKVDELQGKYKTLEDKYNKQKEEWGSSQISILSLVKVREQNEQHSEYHIRLLEREKEQLVQQIERLHKITIKQLEADIEILKKQNQSYANSISTYRTQQGNFKADKSKYEDKIKKYCEQINTYSAGKISDHKQISSLRLEINALKSNFEDKQCKQHLEIQQMTKNNEEQVQKLKDTINLISQELKNQKQETARLMVELEKKSKKLREYDDQYTQYLNKLNAISLENGQLKQQINKLKQKHEKVLIQQRDKAKVLNKEMMEKAQDDFRCQKDKYMKEANEKMRDFEMKSRKDKMEEITALQKQIQMLKNKLESTLKEQEERCVKIEEEKQSAIKQWQQIVVEMNTQKSIIASFEKQLEQYRKNSKLAIENMKLMQSTPKKDSSQTINITPKDVDEDEIRNKQQIISRVASANRQQRVEQATVDVTQDLRFQGVKPQNMPLQVSFKPTPRARVDSQTLKKQLQSLREVRRSVINSQTISSQKSMMCCPECKSQPTIIRKQNKEAHEFDQRLQRQSSKQKYSTHRLGESNSILKSNMYLNQAKHNQNRGFISYQSEYIERPSLSNKRKDEGFKKYQYLRTKTQQNISNSNLEISQGQFKHFFGQGQTNFYKGSKEPQRIVRSVKKQFSLSKSKESDDNDKKLSKCSSLRNVAYDRHLEQIQQYLSFDLGVRSLPRSGSEYKLKERDQICSERMKTYNAETDETSEKAVLMEKIGRINSWRDQVAASKQVKSYNYSKRVPGQTGKSARVLEKDHLGKENINDIIHRKCQYISER